MSFLNRFQASLESLCVPPKNAKYVVAFSGGVDSHVLLRCCAELHLPVRAVHIHHGLQSVADEWVVHCQNICKQLDIQLDVLFVDAACRNGQSPEEAARTVRYAALSENMQDGDCLITAQHQNDQAETLLLQLCRGANAAGLSGMPRKKQLAGHNHIRPLLDFTRQEIVNYAKDNNLRWVEDPSNQDVAFDRNFLRINIMPSLQSRWPEIDKQLANVAAMQSASLNVLEDMAAIDLANAIKPVTYQSKIFSYKVLSVLSISTLKKLSNARLYNVIRFWVLQELAISPTRKLLQEIDKTIINAQQDVSSVIAYAGYEYRKYQDEIYLLKKKNDLDTGVDYRWKSSSTLKLSALNVQLNRVESIGEGLKSALFDKPLTIRFRQGGENFHPVHRQHSQRLKKILQEEGVPPWERGSFPLLYFNDDLVAVIGLWVSKFYAVSENEKGWVVNIEEIKKPR